MLPLIDFRVLPDAEIDVCTASAPARPDSAGLACSVAIYPKRRRNDKTTTVGRKYRWRPYAPLTLELLLLRAGKLA